LVDSADTRFDIRVTEPNQATSIVVDGRVLSAIQPDDCVRIERAETTFKMLTIAGHNDYRALREKLGWSGSAPVRQS
jgi:NAD+ kinase